MKGACDAGVFCPHETQRFPGEFKDGEENKILRSRVLGCHIDAYMKSLKGTEKEDVQFSCWKKCLEGAKAASVEKLYQKIHDEIRKNPDLARKEAKKR